MIPWAKPTYVGKEREYLLDAFDSTWISKGKYVDRLESEFSHIIGRKYAVTTFNGTIALHLALKALGIGAGDEVIVPSFTFASPVNMVIQTGAKPVYADIDPKTWCIDAKDIEGKITDKTKAILAVHLYGNVCDMKPIMKTAKRNDIFVVEDVAESMFSKYDGKFAGSFGSAGCFSFQATKTITTGEGGAVLTDDGPLAKRMRLLRDYGMREGKRYWHDAAGYNYRLTNLQAAIGCAQLEKHEKMIEMKKRAYNRYLENLSDLPGIELQKIQKDVEAVIWAVTVKTDRRRFKGNRDFIMRELLKKGIETRPGFYTFGMMPFYRAPKLPVSDDVSKNVLSLPSYASISNREIDYVCAQLKGLRKK